MSNDAQNNAGGFDLTDEHRMLLTMRDTLYEGDWTDFETDLKARASDRPHVFDTVPASPTIVATIQRHLRLIADMREWETRTGRRLPA